MEKMPNNEGPRVTILRLSPKDKVQLAKLLDFLNKSGFDVGDVDNKLDKENGKVLNLQIKINGSRDAIKKALELDEEYKHLANQLLGSV